jgi:hypothetical protein
MSPAQEAHDKDEEGDEHPQRRLIEELSVRSQQEGHRPYFKRAHPAAVYLNHWQVDNPLTEALLETRYLTTWLRLVYRREW